MDLAARQAINELEGENVSQQDLWEYTRQETEKYNAMENRIRKRLNLTTLKYQHLEDLVQAIGLPREKLCTYCWNGEEIK
jgi:amidophosphoribosyltransferase